MPEFDIQERFYKRNILSYYVKNRFTALYTDLTNTLTEKEIGYIMLGQSYNFSNPEGGLYYKGDPNEDFSDFFGEIRLRFLKELYFKSKAIYDPYNSNLSYYNVLFRWKKSLRDYIKFEYQYSRNDYENIDLRGQIRIFKPLYIFFDTRYDTYNNNDLDTEFGVDIDAGCWGIRLSVENSSGSSGRSSDTSFNFYLYLQGLNVPVNKLGSN